jgi:eukaryotic-like serine/threonine-protein kinase
MIHGLDRERWAFLSPLLDEALDLPRDLRAVWLERLRTRDTATAAQVEELLHEHDRAGEEGFLDASPRPRATLAGQRFGSYTLREPLGSGGMGSVWLAERSDGRYEHRVAVKILNASLVGQEEEARFRREGTLLARLRHRHIAQLIDAGVSPAGQPYLILEHVDGEHLDSYCDRQRLDVRARVRLLLDVVGAVVHAHANLVVHRDLKPSNVLVDRAGSVRLVDFGIAKLLAPDVSGEPATLTIEGRSLLTPAYAAPEQIEGGTVTTATDVYALGVLLYVLLSGRHPFAERLDSPLALARWTVEREPVRLSAAAAAPAADEGPEPRAERRGTTAEGLRRALRGDLETIAAKALRKDPAERYATAEAFAEDLRRHLDNVPIDARRDALGYRAAKFVRRHRLPVAAAAAVALAAAIGSAGIAWQAREAQRERDEAQAQLARATATNDFFHVLLDLAAPPGGKLEVGQLLEQGALVADRHFAADDPVLADVLVMVGRHFMAAESWEKATPLLERAAEIGGRSADPAHRARALCALAQLRSINGDASGQALMAEALARLPADDRSRLPRAECLLSRANLAVLSDDAGATIADAGAALALLDQLPFPALVLRVEAIHLLAYGRYLAGRNREADEAYGRLWTLLATKGLDRTSTASSILNNWALVHYLGDLARAESLCRRAIELRRLTEDATTIIPTLTYNHAGTLLRLARYEEARAAYEQTIETASSRQEHRIRFDAMMELSELFVESGDLPAAAAQLARVARSADHPRFDSSRRALLSYHEGRLALARGEPARALERLAAAETAFERKDAKLAVRVFSRIARARAEQALGRATDALASAQSARTMAESFVEPDAPSYLVGHARLAEAELQRAQGQDAASRDSFRLARLHLERTLGPGHPATAAAGRGASAE